MILLNNELDVEDNHARKLIQKMKKKREFQKVKINIYMT